MAEFENNEKMSGLDGAFEKKKTEAAKTISDPEKTNTILDSLVKFMERGKTGPLGKFFEDIMLLVDLIRDNISGKYTELPLKSAITILGAIIYIVSPIDLIPDVIPIIGLTDDMAVLLLAMKAVESDVEKYKKWKTGMTEVRAEWEINRE